MEQQITTLELSSENQIAALDLAEQESRDLAEMLAQAQIDELQTLVDNSEAQLNALLGIKQSADTLTGAVSDFLIAVDVLANSLFTDFNQTGTGTITDNIKDLAEASKKDISPPLRTIQASSTEGTGFTQEEILMQIAKNTGKTANIQLRWDGDGIPEERNVA